MHTLLPVILGISGIFGRTLTWAEEDYIWQQNPFPAGERFDEFDWNLCKALSKSAQGNAVVSPVSVKLVLAMLYEGSNGETSRELESALNLPHDRRLAREKFATILRSLQLTHNDYLLELGNKLYLDQRIVIRRLYQRILKVFYGTDIESIDFSQSTTAVRNINEWVEGVTHGHIHELVTEDEAPSQTLLLLLNALYFKGSWERPFDTNSTVNETFHVSSTESVPVPMMKRTTSLYVAEVPELDSNILRLPYVGSKYSMFIILPNKKDGLSQLMAEVNSPNVRKALRNMEEMTVITSLPKFNVEFTAHVRDILEEMGIREIFTEKADLSGISRSRLTVSSILQKAGLMVDEEGSTGYAATDLVMVPMFGNEEVVFNADHPFLFFIQDEQTDTVVFVGKITNPGEHGMQAGNSHIAENTENTRGLYDWNSYLKNQRLGKTT